MELFCLFVFFCLWSRWENTKTSCKHITLTTRRTPLSRSLSLFLSPPVLYSLEERAEAPSVTPYCGPLTCQGAMWSILMSINHYHNNSHQSVVRRRQKAARFVAPEVMCVEWFAGCQSLVVLLFLDPKWIKVKCVIFGEFVHQQQRQTALDFCALSLYMSSLGLPVYYSQCTIERSA